MTRLTAKEEAFALAIVAGKGPSDAYEAAGYAKCNPNVTKVAAHRIGNRERVTARIQQLRDRAARPAVLSRARKLELLAKMVEHGDGEVKTSEQLKALEIDNRMQGHNEAEKVKVFGMGGLMQKIRAAAPKP